MAKKIATDYQITGNHLICYYENGRGPAAIALKRDKYESWLRYNHRMHSLFICDGDETIVPMSSSEYWQELSKEELLKDMTDFINLQIHRS